MQALQQILTRARASYGKTTAIAVLLLTASPLAIAHNPLTGTVHERAAGGLSALVLLAAWFVYGRGSFVIRPSVGSAVTCHSAFLLCVVTVLGPLDDLAGTSTAAHMLQHMLMIAVIAPLWVLGRPLPQLHAGGARYLAAIWRPLLRLASRPMPAAFVHGAVIWFWHMPTFYMLAVQQPWWHTIEHALFLSTAGVFWWSVLRASTVNSPDVAMALLFTLMHTGFLGALLTFSPEPVYHEARSLADQQLAGLIMWVAGAIPYLVAAGWVLRRWYLRQAG